VPAPACSKHAHASTQFHSHLLAAAILHTSTLQVEGVAWLLAQHQRGLNSILADEMGLGKTLQSIAFLATLKWGLGVPGPHLVVVPLSVMSSWMAELARCVASRDASC
jgi:SNF2 family DNA or RNA helicase